MVTISVLARAFVLLLSLSPLLQQMAGPGSKSKDKKDKKDKEKDKDAEKTAAGGTAVKGRACSLFSLLAHFSGHIVSLSVKGPFHGFKKQIGLYRDDGKENGSHYIILGLLRGHIGMMLIAVASKAGAPAGHRVKVWHGFQHGEACG